MTLTLSGFVLASSSPRRLELLKQVQLTPDHIVAAEIDETPLPQELPLPYVKRMAKEKADRVAASCQDALVLAADTVVCCGRRILPKAETPEMVTACMQLLSGRRHRVYTAVVLLEIQQGQCHHISQRCVETVVQWKKMHPEEIRAYSQSPEGIGKAGGYAIQGTAAGFVKSIHGSYSNIVGLPLYETMQMLQGRGYGR